MNTNRSDYILIWTSKDSPCMNNSYCSLCRIQYKGAHCPTGSRCTKYIASPHAFNNVNHIIIATKDFCKGKQYGCNVKCVSCTITCTYNTVKILV